MYRLTKEPINVCINISGRYIISVYYIIFVLEINTNYKIFKFTILKVKFFYSIYNYCLQYNMLRNNLRYGKKIGNHNSLNAPCD